VDRFQKELEASFVLRPLLVRSDLSDEAAKNILRLALAWVDRFQEELEAGFVLPPLLRRGDLGERAAEAIELALVWLKAHSQTKDAEFVLKHMFRRQDVTPIQIIDLKRAAVQRLAPRVRDPKDDEVSFLLRWCLRCRVNDPKLDEELLELSITWLENNRQNRKSDFVFNGVLRRQDASEEQWVSAARHGLSWLQQTPHVIPSRDYAINSLLTRPQLLSNEEIAFVVREAISWLQKNPGHHESDRLRRGVEMVKARLSPGHPLFKELDHMHLDTGTP
jgi:hypothetical protein